MKKTLFFVTWILIGILSFNPEVQAKNVNMALLDSKGRDITSDPLIGISGSDRSSKSAKKMPVAIVVYSLPDLKAAIASGGTQTIVLGANIQITESLTIPDNSNFTFDLTSQGAKTLTLGSPFVGTSPIFNTAVNGTVTIDFAGSVFTAIGSNPIAATTGTGKFTIKNATFTSFGSGITTAGAGATVEVIGCTFESNNFGGSAIKAPKIISTDTDFKLNPSGTGLLWSTISTNVSGCLFDFNSGPRGVIYSDAAANTITISSNSIFSNNISSSGNSGPVIYKTNGSLIVSNSTFTKNNSKLNGGVIYSANGSINISSSSFTENICSSNGGVIFNVNGAVTINGSTFSDNTATSNGGVISNTTGAITISNSSTFSNNKGQNGGVINSADQNNVIDISNSSLLNNTATALGGAIYMLNPDKLKFNTVTSTGNRANAVVDYKVATNSYLTSSYLNIQNVTTDPGVTYVYNNNDVYLNIFFTVTFDSNGGSGVASVSNIIKGEFLSKPTNPTKASSSFLGWTKTLNGTDYWSFKTDPSPEPVMGNTTIHAKWNLISSSTAFLDDVMVFIGGVDATTMPGVKTDLNTFVNTDIDYYVMVPIGTTSIDITSTLLDPAGKYTLSYLTQSPGSSTTTVISGALTNTTFPVPLPDHVATHGQVYTQVKIDVFPSDGISPKKTYTITVTSVPTVPTWTTDLSSTADTYIIDTVVTPLTVQATAESYTTGFNYQWYSNTTNSTTGGTAISGATSTSYTPSSVTTGTKYYYCVATSNGYFNQKSAAAYSQVHPVTVINSTGLFSELPSIDYPTYGTASNPFIISKVSDLVKMSKYVNGTDPTADVSDILSKMNLSLADFTLRARTGSYSLTNDVDMSALAGNFTPIGNVTANASNVFKGDFNGNNHSILNLKFNATSKTGFFGQIDAGALVHDLTVNTLAVPQGGNTGVLVGVLAGGTIRNVTTTGNFSNYNASNHAGMIGQMTGGLVENSNAAVNITGYNFGCLVYSMTGGTIDNCQASSGGNAAKGHVSGFVFQMDGGLIKNSNSSAVIRAGDADGVGNSATGFVYNMNNGTIQNCIRTGPITYKGGTTYAGFVMNMNGGLINGSSTSSTFPATEGVLGTIAGGFVYTIAGGIIQNSNSTSAIPSKTNIGGFAYMMTNGTVDNCFYKGNLTTTGHAGGFVEYIRGGNIKNSYFEGNITASSGNGNVGGFAAIADVNPSTIKDCHAISTVTGRGITGGFIAQNDKADIRRSYIQGSVSGTETNFNIGGFAGKSSATMLSNAARVSSVNGPNPIFVGKFYGLGSGTIKDCYVSKDVTTNGTAAQALAYTDTYTLAQLNTVPLYDGLDYPNYVISPSTAPGTYLSLPGDVLSLSDPGSYSMYYTVDGTIPAVDPVAGPNASTFAYTAPISVVSNKTITAVSYDGTNLGPVSAFQYVVISKDPSLSAISTVPGGSVTGFDPNTYTYNIEVPYGTTSVSVTGTATDSASTVTVTGGVATTAAGSGTISTPNVGMVYPSTIHVVAENVNYTKDYTVNIIQRPETPSITSIAPAIQNAVTGDLVGAITVSANPLTTTGALSYQWYSNTTATNSGGTAIASATAASYTPPTQSCPGDYYYYCVVTNTDGVSTATAASPVAKVTYIDTINPTITAPADLTILSNNGCTATSVDLGTPTTADNCTVSSVLNDAPTIFPLGNTTVTWTVKDSSNNTATITQLVTVNANVVPPITGTTSVCMGSTSQLNDAMSGGIWSSSDSSVATVDPTGNVTGVSAGTATITYEVTDNSVCVKTVTELVTVNPVEVVEAITGRTSVCVGSDIQLSDATANGVWSSSDNNIAIVDQFGKVSGIAGGAVTISYSVGNAFGCVTTVNHEVAVNALAVVYAITGKPAVCVGVDNKLENATPGGVWSSNNTGVAIVDQSGNVTSLSAGTATISYSLTNASNCVTTVTQDVTVNALPVVAAISGAGAVCQGSDIQLSDATPGGVWSSSDIAIATIDATGLVTGVSDGSVTISYTVTDGNGCVTTVTHMVTVNAVPVVEPITGDSMVCAESDIQLSNATVDGVWSSSDPAIATVDATGKVTGKSAGTVTISYAVTNPKGCKTTSTKVVTINELPDVPPISGRDVVCWGSTIQLSNTTAGGVWTSSDPLIASIDGNGLVTGLAGAGGVTTISYTVTHPNSCVKTQTIDVTADPQLVVYDIKGDTSICLGNFTQLTDDTPDGVWISSDPSVATVDQTGLVTSVKEGTTTITYSVTNANMCETRVTQDVVIQDIIAPTITAPDAVIVSADSQCVATGVALGDPTTADNCGVKDVTNDAPTVFPLGETIVTWTVTDNKGNVATATQKVTVEDNEVPTITAPVDVIVSTDNGCTATSVVLGDPTTADNCGVKEVTNDAPTVFPLGETIVTWTVIDNSGNEATITQTVTVKDTEVPTITAPDALIVSTDNGCTATSVALGDPTTADNCGVERVTSNAPLAFPLGETIVTWTVTDKNGNVATATQTVTVKDTEVPTITAPDAVIVSTDNGCTATSVALGDPTTADNCGVDTVSNDAPTVFPLGDTTVTWTVTDNNGNVATATQTVTVKDTEVPTITAPGALIVSANSQCEATRVDLGTPVTADNCGVKEVSNDAPTVFPLGDTTVTWMVTDNSLNVATTTQTVTVKDTEVPTITAPGALIVSANSQCEATRVDLGTPVTADNCGVKEVSNDAPTVFPLGETTVTWTVTDNSLNVATTTQTVTVKDTEVPTITAPAAVTVSVINGCPATAVALGSPVTADNCGVREVTNDAPAVFPIGNTNVTWTVIDSNGNIAIVTQTVTVNNVMISAIAGTTSLCDGSNTQLTNATTGGVWSSSNAAVATIDASGLVTGNSVGTAVITYVVTNSNGCKASVTTDVTINECNPDKDGDGVLDVTEVQDGTNPLDPCSFIFSHQTLSPSPDWLIGDCDNDGLINEDEIKKDTNRGDGVLEGTDPLNRDTDGDGVLDGVKVKDGTNPLDPCSFVQSHQTVEPSSGWKAADCDSDGLNNGEELKMGTDPLKPDTDGDGVLDGVELLSGTDPLESCDYNKQEVSLAQSAEFLDGDCDGDKLSNKLEIGNDPKRPNDSNGNGKPDFLEPSNHSSANEDGVEIYNALSPNGDGINDVFVIGGIQNYPNNSFEVFNRWGARVYATEGYAQSGNFFTGFAEGKGVAKQSEGLPEGTYFYVLRYVNDAGVAKTRSGYLYIKK